MWECLWDISLVSIVTTLGPKAVNVTLLALTKEGKLVQHSPDPPEPWSKEAAAPCLLLLEGQGTVRGPRTGCVS